MRQKKTTKRVPRTPYRFHEGAAYRHTTKAQQEEHSYQEPSLPHYPKVHIPSSLASAPVLG